GPCPLPERARRTAWLPDGRPGDALDQERRGPAHLRREHARARRRPPRIPFGDPQRRRRRTLMPTNGSADDSLSVLVNRLTGELGGVSHREIGGTTESLRGGSAFAVLRGRQIELRLRADIAEAALRTTSTSSSGRGADWIVFEPNPDEPQ